MISFADSTDPASIPASFTHVAAYSNGLYVWEPDQLARFPAHIEIGVKPGQPQQAKDARVLDVERFDAFPADFPPFALERHALGHNDPTLYCSIDTLPAVLDAIKAQGYGLSWRLWIAWWWLKPFPPAAFEVAAEIKTLTGITTLPGGTLWACQWQNGTDFDTSVLYGRDDFTR